MEPNDLDKLYINVIKANQKLLDLANDRAKFARSESILFKACTQAMSSQTPFGTPALSRKFGGDSAVNKALEGVYDRIKPAGQKEKSHQEDKSIQSNRTHHVLRHYSKP